jgi:hypothetical protein
MLLPSRVTSQYIFEHERIKAPSQNSGLRLYSEIYQFSFALLLVPLILVLITIFQDALSFRALDLQT